jgi:hypothetical protein
MLSMQVGPRSFGCCFALAYTDQDGWVGGWRHTLGATPRDGKATALPAQLRDAAGDQVGHVWQGQGALCDSEQDNARAVRRQRRGGADQGTALSHRDQCQLHGARVQPGQRVHICGGNGPGRCTCADAAGCVTFRSSPGVVASLRLKTSGAHIELGFLSVPEQQSWYFHLRVLTTQVSVEPTNNDDKLLSLFRCVSTASPSVPG